MWRNVNDDMVRATHFARKTAAQRVHANTDKKSTYDIFSTNLDVAVITMVPTGTLIVTSTNWPITVEAGVGWKCTSSSEFLFRRLAL